MNRTRIAPSDSECVQRIAATCGESPMWSVREQALYWTDNLGGVIHRLEPESGSDQKFRLGQNVMGIGMRERGGTTGSTGSVSGPAAPVPRRGSLVAVRTLSSARRLVRTCAKSVDLRVAGFRSKRPRR